jgi:hypothetical protein
MANSKSSKTVSPAKKFALLCAVAVAAVGAAYFMWVLPATESAGRAVDDANSAVEQADKVRAELEEFASPEAVAALAAQAAAADALIPFLSSEAAEASISLEFPRAVDNAASAAGGQFNGELDIEPIPLLGVPPTLRAAKVSFTVTLPPEQYSQFVAALVSNGALFTTTSFDVSAQSGDSERSAGGRDSSSTSPLSLTGPADFVVTGLVWWSTASPQGAGTPPGS